MSTIIFTLGYEKTTIEEYTSRLKKAKVTTLIDVRERAWSRKKDFCKTRFSTYLEEHGIQYVHVPEAGNPSEIRKSSKNVKQVLKKYERYLSKNEEGILQILGHLGSSQKQVICLTCVEKDYAACHRSIITTHLLTMHKSFRVQHL